MSLYFGGLNKNDAVCIQSIIQIELWNEDYSLNLLRKNIVSLYFEALLIHIEITHLLFMKRQTLIIKLSLIRSITYV